MLPVKYLDASRKYQPTPRCTHTMLCRTSFVLGLGCHIVPFNFYITTTTTSMQGPFDMFVLVFHSIIDLILNQMLYIFFSTTDTYVWTKEGQPKGARDAYITSDETCGAGPIICQCMVDLLNVILESFLFDDSSQFHGVGIVVIATDTRGSTQALCC